MDDCNEFGNCLNKLLSVLNINCSKLAKGINIDASLVNRWIRGSRVPAYNSNYIQLISAYICSNIYNTYQEKAIFDFLNTICCEKGFDPDKSLYEKVKFYLSEAQGYTIELKKKIQTKVKQTVNTKNIVLDFISGYYSNNPAMYKSDQKDNPEKAGDIPSSITNRGFSDYISIESKLIVGYKEIQQGVLNLLRIASESKEGGKDPIYITINSNLFTSPSNTDFHLLWEKELLNLLKNGWRVICLITINNDIARTNEIINIIGSFFGTGNFTPYYLKKYYLFSTGRECLFEISAILPLLSCPYPAVRYCSTGP